MLLGNIDIAPLLHAANSFYEAMGQVNSELTRDGAIQRFEYTFELCWKTMRRLLKEKGSEVNHPKDVFREAAAEKWIDDPRVWFDFLEKRNKTSHIYKKQVADEVFAALGEFMVACQKFIAVIQKTRS